MLEVELQTTITLLRIKGVEPAALARAVRLYLN